LEETPSTQLKVEYKWSLIWKEVSVYYPVVVVPVKLIVAVNRQVGAILFVFGRAIAKAKLAFPV